MTIPPNPHPEQLEAKRKVLRGQTPDDVIRAIYAAEGWQRHHKGGFNTCTARCNSLYDITADAPRNRYVATPKVASLANRPADDGEPWQSIDTAPKDGTWFVAEQDGETYPCQWERSEPDEGAPHEGWFDLFNQSFEAPTGWHPVLPIVVPPQPEGVKPSLVADCVDMGTPQPYGDAVAEIMEKRSVTRAEAERCVDASGMYAVQPEGVKRP